MVGEVGLSGDVEARDVGLQVVVHPQATHRVVHGGVDAHGDLVGVIPGDALVHLEQVAVAGRDGVLAQTVDGLGEVQVDAATHHPLVAVGVALLDGRSHAATLVAHVLGLAGGDVARHEVAEGRVDALEVVVARLLGDVARVLVAVLGLLGHPDASVVAQGLTHEGELGLEVPGLRDAGGVDLRVAGVGEVGALAVRAPDGGGVASHRVGGQEEHVAVAAAGQHDGVGHVGLDLPGDHVAGDDAAGTAVDDDELDHLVATELLNRAGVHLTLKGLVGADEELLAGLSAGVEGAGDLHATEGAVVQQAAVLTGEGDALGHALVDDVGRDLRQAVDVVLTGAVVAALDRVVEEPVGGVSVVAVVLRGVDTALGGDGVRPASRVLVEEHLDVVALLSQGGGRGAARQAGADDNDVQLAAVGGVDQLGLELALLPAPVDRDGVGGLGVGDLLALVVQAVDEFSHSRSLSVGRRSTLGEVLGGGADRVTELRVVVGGGHGGIDIAEEDRRRNSHERGEQSEGQHEGDQSDEGDGASSHRTQCLQGGPHAVPHVQAQGGQRDRVDEPHPPQLEAVVHVEVGPSVHVLPSRRQRQGGVLQEVPDDEQQEDDTAPAHGAHGVAGGEVLGAGLLDGVLVVAAGPLVARPQVEGAAGVSQEAGHESKAEDPQDTAVRHDRHQQCSQEHGIVVVSNLTLEVVEVAVGVEEDEEQEHQPRDRHHALHEDGRGEGGPPLQGRSRCFGHGRRLAGHQVP